MFELFLGYKRNIVFNNCTLLVFCANHKMAMLYIKSEKMIIYRKCIPPNERVQPHSLDRKKGVVKEFLNDRR